MFSSRKWLTLTALLAGISLLSTASSPAQGPPSAPNPEIAALEAQLDLLRRMTTELENKLKAARERQRGEPGRLGMPGGGPPWMRGPGLGGMGGFGKMDEKMMREMQQRFEKMRESWQSKEKPKDKEKGKAKGKEKADKEKADKQKPKSEKERPKEAEASERQIRERLERLMREVEELRKQLKR